MGAIELTFPCDCNFLQSKSSLTRRRLRPSLLGRSSHGGRVSPSKEEDMSGLCSPGRSDSPPVAPETQDLSSPPPFTHFLANFDHSMAFDNSPEEIVSSTFISLRRYL